MNTTRLRSKRVILPTIAAVAVAVVGVGGTVWAASADDELQGRDRDQAGAAATEAAGGGTVVEAESSDDPGEAYEVEIRMDDGTEVEVRLDGDFNVISQHTDRNDAADEPDDDADDRPLNGQQRTSAERAALSAVGGGTVTDLEFSDDRGVAYEAEVRDDGGVEWDVDLGADFTVIGKQVDD